MQIAYGDAILATTLSIGVTVALPGAENSAEALLSRVEEAMNFAVNAGMNRVVIDETMQGG